MANEPVLTANAPAPIGPYSQAIRSGNELYVSGQIAIDPATGEVVAGDVMEQTEQVLKNLCAVVKQAGFEFEDIVKTTIYLMDMYDFTAVNTIYSKYFGVIKPARSTVAVAGLPKGVRIEIDAIARKN